MGWEKWASFVGLVIVNVCLSLLISLSKSSGHTYTYNPASAITIAEVVKMLMSMTSYWREKDASDDVKSYFSLKFILSYFSLAVMYCLNNQLTFVILSMTNPGNLTLFKASTPLMTAMLQWMLFGVPLSKLRWACVIILCTGLVLTQWNDCNMSLHIKAEALLALVFSVLLTSISSVLNASAIQSFSSVPLNVHNFTLYFFGAILNANTYLLASAGIININSDAGFFQGYNNVYALLVVFLNSVIGIVITLLYKYGDAIIKCFAQVISSIALVMLSVFLFDYTLTVSSLCGCVSVFVASYIYLILSPQIEIQRESKHQEQKSETETQKLLNSEESDDDGEEV